MAPIRFTGVVRYWNPEKGSGLAVVDVPGEHHVAIGGLRQQHVRGTINGVPFASNVAPARAGRLALSVSRAMLAAARAAIGDAVAIEISGVGRE